jgi:uncharacterized protein (TIRG00374 family)
VTKGTVLALSAARTRILLSPIRLYSFRDAFVPWLTGYVTNNVLPFRLGELVRVDLLARAGRISRGSTIAVVALDRLLDLMSLLLLLVLVAPLLAVDVGSDRKFLVVVVFVVTATATALTFSARPTLAAKLVSWISHPLGTRARLWLTEKAERFSDGLAALQSARKVLMVVVVTLLARLVGLCTIQCWLWAFGLELPYYAPVVVMLFLSAGTMIPSSPGFIGTFHVACAYALELMGVEPATAASVAIAGHFMATVPWTVIGLSVGFQSIRRLWRQQRDSLLPPKQAVGTPP